MRIALFIIATFGLLAQAQPASPLQRIDQGLLTRPPAVLHSIDAAYPPGARAEGLTGTVRLQLDISETGQVSQISILQPAGHGFDQAAVEAVRQFTFSPAEVDGKPTAVRVTYDYHFVLDQAPPAPLTQEPDQRAVNFTGQIRRRGNRKPLSAAVVSLPALGRSAITDENGGFSFSGIANGKVSVLVVAPGYERFETDEQIEPGRVTRASYYLKQLSSFELETVVRGDRDRREVTRTTLEAEEVQRVPGTNGDSLKVVQNLPGVARARFNGGEIVIRGVGSTDSGFYLDGMRIPLLYHFGGLASVYNSHLLASVDFLPGNYSTYYGDQIGGVVDIKSRPASTQGLHGYAKVDLLDASVELEGPITRTLSFNLAGRRSYIGALLKATGLASSFSVAPVYADAQLRLDWRPTPHHTFTFLTLTDDDRLKLTLDRPSNNDPSVNGDFNLHTGFTQFRLRHIYRNGPLFLDTIGLLGPSEISAGVGTARALHLNSHEYNLRSSIEYEASPWLTPAAGIDIAYQRSNVDAMLERPPAEDEPQIPGALRPKITARRKVNVFLPSAWVELRLRPFRRLLLLPGLRAESYIYSNQTQPDGSLNPRLGIRFSLTDKVTLKGGLGLNHEPAKREEPTPEFGNPNLRARKSLQASLGTEIQATREISGRVEGFYNRLYNLPVTSLTPGPPYLTNDGIGRSYGVELLVRHALTRRFFGWIAYTLSRSDRLDHPGRSFRPFAQDQTHVLTALASYRLPRDWQVGARFRYATGNLTTPVIGARRSDNVDVFAPLYGRVNSERLPGVVQLDIRVDKTWVYDLWALDLYLDIQNVFNHRAVEGVTYSYNYRQRQYFTGLPILPILGVKGTF